MGIRDAAAGCRGDGDHRVGLTNANLAAKPPTSTVRSCLAGISMTMSSIRSYNADRDGFDQRCCRSGGEINGFCAVRLRVFLSDLKGGKELRFSDGLLQHGSDFVLVQP
jgi:hypothetical protein